MNLIPRRFYLDDIFNDLISKTDESMKCDVYEKDNKYHIEMDIPGYDKEDVKIEVKDNYLNIIAEKQSEEEEKDKNYLRRERCYGKITRSFYLSGLDEENIDAEFKNGMLKIVISKVDENKIKKFIEIK